MQKTIERKTTESSVTIGILTYNSAQTISATLESLKLQTLPRRFWNTIIVDHNSTDGTKQLLENFVANDPSSQLVVESANNIARSRQLILDGSLTRFLVFLDSDVTLPPKWLEIALARAEALASTNPSFAGLGGALRLRALHSRLFPIENLQSNFLGHFATEQMAPARKSRRASHLPTAAVIFLRRPLLASNGFDVGMANCGEDLELGERLTSLGHTLWVDPSLQAEHVISCATWLEWCRRSFRFGRARIRVSFLQARLWRDHQIVLPITLASVMFVSFISLIFDQSRGIGVALLFFTLGLHWLIAVFGFIDLRRPLFGLKVAALTWLTHQSYAWGEFYELFSSAAKRITKGRNRSRARRFLRWSDRVKALALSRT